MNEIKFLSQNEKNIRSDFDTIFNDFLSDNGILKQTCMRMMQDFLDCETRAPVEYRKILALRAELLQRYAKEFWATTCFLTSEIKKNAEKYETP